MQCLTELGIMNVDSVSYGPTPVHYCLVSGYC